MCAFYGRCAAGHAEIILLVATPHAPPSPPGGPRRCDPYERIDMTWATRRTRVVRVGRARQPDVWCSKKLRTISPGPPRALPTVLPDACPRVAPRNNVGIWSTGCGCGVVVGGPPPQKNSFQKLPSRPHPVPVFQSWRKRAAATRPHGWPPGPATRPPCWVSTRPTYVQGGRGLGPHGARGGACHGERAQDRIEFWVATPGPQHANHSQISLLGLGTWCAAHTPCPPPPHPPTHP